MSKAKPKDKKNDASSQLQKQVETQKRIIIDYEYTIKKMEERLLDRNAENKELNEQLEQTRQLVEHKMRVMNSKIEEAQKSHDQQIDRITDLELAGNKAEARIKSLREEVNMEKQNRLREVTELKQRIETQKLKSELKLKSLREEMDQREANEIEIEELRQKLREERDQKISDLADKEREKVQAIDKLRDDMLKEIREMHTKYVSLKKEQLDTTTRLTILQNHQLTSQLEYQSKQTENLIFEEEDMRQKIKQLNQQLAIHKEVEEQLAKRAHFSKGVIQKLNARVAELQAKLAESQEVNRRNNDTRILSEKMTDNPQQHLLSKEINGEAYAELQGKIAVAEDRYAEILVKLDAASQSKEAAERKIDKYENSTNQLAKIMIRFADGAFNAAQGQLKELSLDPVCKREIEELKTKEIEQWTNSQLNLLVKLLLNLLKPYLNRANLKMLAIKDAPWYSDCENQGSSRKLPKLLGEHSNKGLKDLPINIASKIVASNLRQWGSTVRYHDGIKKKYKFAESGR